LQSLLGKELVFDTKASIEEDCRMAVVAYIDDILIGMKGSFEKHHMQVSSVFQLLMDNHMCIEIDKCIFDAKAALFLGLMFSRSGLRMNSDKARSIVVRPRPTNKHKVPQLLGFWKILCRFIPGSAATVSPMKDLLRGQDTVISWNEAQDAAFLKITIWFTLGKTPILRHYDPNRPALLETNASDSAIAGILSHKFEDGKICLITFI
jgi:hypothetical protein